MTERRVRSRTCDERLQDEIHGHQDDAQPDQEFHAKRSQVTPPEYREQDPDRQEYASHRAGYGQYAHHWEQRLRPAVQPEEDAEVQLLHQRRCQGAARIWLASVWVSARTATIDATTSRWRARASFGFTSGS